MTFRTLRRMQWLRRIQSTKRLAAGMFFDTGHRFAPPHSLSRDGTALGLSSTSHTEVALTATVRKTNRGRPRTTARRI